MVVGIGPGLACVSFWQFPQSIVVYRELCNEP